MATQPSATIEIPDAEWLSVKDMAEALGVSDSYVRMKIDDGTIPAIRTGRGIRVVKTEDFLKFARARYGKPRSRGYTPPAKKTHQLE